MNWFIKERYCNQQDGQSEQNGINSSHRSPHDNENGNRSKSGVTVSIFRPSNAPSVRVGSRDRLRYREMSSDYDLWGTQDIRAISYHVGGEKFASLVEARFTEAPYLLLK